MLNKRLSRLKWTCLVALAVGVAIVQLQGVQTGSRGGASSHSMNRLTGFCAVTLACISKPHSRQSESVLTILQLLVSQAYTSRRS